MSNKTKTLALKNFKDDVAIVMQVLELNKTRTIRFRYSAPKPNGKTAGKQAGESMYPKQATRQKVLNILENTGLGAPKARKGWIEAGPSQIGFYSVPKTAPRKKTMMKVVREMAKAEAQAVAKAARRQPYSTDFATMANLKDMESRIVSLIETALSSKSRVETPLERSQRRSEGFHDNNLRDEIIRTRQPHKDLITSSPHLPTACFIALQHTLREGRPYFVFNNTGLNRHMDYQVWRGMDESAPEGYKLQFFIENGECIVTGGLIEER